MRSETRLEIKDQDLSPRSCKVWSKVAVIVLNWNGWRDTIECLESLFRNNYPNYQVIVVDNGSTDGSLEKIKKWAEGKQEIVTPELSHLLCHLSHPPIAKPIPYIEFNRKKAEEGGNPKRENELISKWVKKKTHSPTYLSTHYPLIFIQTEENLGFAGGINVGIRYSLTKGDFRYIWLLNNDTVIEGSSLKELVFGIERYTNVVAVGSKILYYDNPKLLQNVGSKIDKKSFFKLCKPILDLNKENVDMGQYDNDFEVNDIIGASLLVKKEIVQKIGLMPEEYFLYGEETDWNFNFQKHGYKLMTICRSKIYHKKGRAIGGDDSPITLYYRSRNQLILHRKYMNLPLYVSYASLYFIKKIFSALKLNNKSQKIIFKALFDGIKRIKL